MMLCYTNGRINIIVTSALSQFSMLGKHQFTLHDWLKLLATEHHSFLGTNKTMERLNDQFGACFSVHHLIYNTRFLSNIGMELRVGIQ